MNNSKNIVIYGNGLFQDDTPPYSQQLAQMQNAGYTTVVLWALHVHDNGDFYYNDNLAVHDGKIMTSSDPSKKWLNPEFAQLVQELKASGRVKQVLFSIGPFESDFNHIMANLDAATANFKALIAAAPIDGFDFDYEGSYSATDSENLAQLTLLLNQLGMVVTYCPYTYEDFWFNCLAEVYKQNGNQQAVDWFNLQCYDGGASNNPLQWADALQNYSSPLGIADPRAFIIPGYWAKQNYSIKSIYGKCPNEIQTIFAGYSGSGLQGGFIWNSSDVFKFENSGLCGTQAMTPTAYAQAILNGLNVNG